MFGVLNKIASTVIFLSIMIVLVGYSGYFLWYKLLNVDPQNFDKVNVSKNEPLEETSDDERECVPFDEEDSFDTSVTEQCINPARLRVPDYKMDEYLDNKCSRLDEDLQI